MGPEIEFRVLGPLEVRVGGVALVIGAAKQRVLLAALLLQAGDEVRFEELTGTLWESAPPASPRAALHTYVRRLRQALPGPDLINTTEHGYRVDLAPEQLDLFRLRSLITGAERARAAEDADSERACLAEALDLWRGPVLVDIPSEPLRQTDAARLSEQRLVLLERRIELDLDLGRHRELVGELTELTTRHPLRERFWEQLLLAQVRGGRQAEALRAFGRISSLLKAELGVRPGAALRALHEAILRADTSLYRRAQRKPVPPGPVPAQLPADIPDFIGRAALTEQIGEALTGSGLVALSGPPGAGKTALAVHTGHRLREHFPDGQLHVNLRGYAPEPALAPEQILARFLRALGVRPEQVPIRVEAQTAMYRRLLADRRVLVLLDNAADPAQIAPLLPESPGCAVLVTSRTEFPHSIPVGMLDPAESVDLLSSILGPAAVRAEPESVAALADTCAHLPLALRVAAANLLGHQVGDYLDQLRQGDRLAKLAVDGDAAAAVRLTFDLSYTELAPDRQYAFRTLALAPGTDLSLRAAAVMLDWPIDQAREVLTNLVTVSLLQTTSLDRYGYHDLIRLYARQKAGPDGTEVARLDDYILGAAHDAAELIMPEPLSAELDRPGARGIEQFEDLEQALAWLDTERGLILAIIQAAGESDRPWVSWSLARALRNYFYFYDHRAEWLIAAEAALRAAEHSGNTLMVASMSDGVGTAFWSVGDYERARQSYGRAQELLGSAAAGGEVLAGIRLHIGIVALETGHAREAESAAALALAHWRDAGSAKQIAQALVNLGTAKGRSGDLGQARRLMLEAIKLCRRIESRFGEGLCATNLTYTCLVAGDYAVALDWSGRALAINAELGRTEPDCFEHLATIHCALGRLDEAAALAARARQTAQESGDRRAEIDAMITTGQIHLRAGRTSEALEACTEAFRQSTLIGYGFGEIEAMVAMSAALHYLGRPGEAVDYAGRALMLSSRHGLTLESGHALTAMAEARLAEGLAEEAGELVRRALDTLDGTGHRPGVAAARVLAGHVRHRLGELDSARQEWETALELFVDMGVPDAENVRGLLLTARDGDAG
ncbi:MULTISPECIES: BTAD domain-containing putative transcriptional regulator [unclassified Crossiella]|uniref:AfsR/SARP family transcriptional regulator n=1 Tax=unclassified Crossiella TaxID=2620835 RepID=UPI001FFE8A3D|nr:MULTISPECIES: BTAD domain-containing putative transcriptional regulator [unclassified Crossiella]MCK2237947.1 tetratricopeptide repeat protein [Crossiella sp. S99.2]MCK2255230.1 tetratricopeptide repeat protein [Crossiella sp. S99.1]